MTQGFARVAVLGLGGEMAGQAHPQKNALQVIILEFEKHTELAKRWPSWKANSRFRGSLMNNILSIISNIRWSRIAEEFSQESNR
ncbi:MAG: hypothetical protein M2R45_03912 [Verrucomicrobia subdivision 3 bacterium]|nr:hypothetical protein [Limisphaerales bacterium]MCS1417507.1 hypothetical protein [Limisphaerales bacterium]